jgi:hypothetical protein
MNLQIENYIPMESRPCEYCLSLQDSCVFSDFGINAEGCLYLLRISFDGYGCCTPTWCDNPVTMSKEHSDGIINSIKNNTLQDNSNSKILSLYFESCRTFIWQDALLEHSLI